MPNRTVRKKLERLSKNRNTSFSEVLDLTYGMTELPGIATNYSLWINEVERDLNRKVYSSEQDSSILFSIIVVDTTARSGNALIDSLHSVVNQSFSNHEVIAVTSNGIDLNDFHQIINLQTYRSSSNSTLFDNYNTALGMCSGDFVLFLAAGDLLAPKSVELLSDCCSQTESVRLIVADEDLLDSSNNRTNPCFKPDWNPDYLNSFNYFSKGVIYDKELITELGGFNPVSIDPYHDLSLRATQELSKNQIDHISTVLFHFKQRSANIVHRVKYDIPIPTPLVSIIIPTKDQLDVLRTCVCGILDKTQYKNIEIIIVDNQSEQKKTKNYLNKLNDNPAISILQYNKPYNFSDMNNFAVQRAKGSILTFLNNDISVISNDWLSELVAHACRPEIGCVGAKLFYPDGTIQHAGVILGLKGYASHAHKCFSGQSSGYFNRLIVTHNVSAVTAACMVLRKDVFEQVGGFDAVNLKVAYNDIDLCLKVNNLGLRNLFTPHAKLIHHESKSRGKKRKGALQRQLKKESDYFRLKWGKQFFSDPAYNINLTLQREDFSLGSGRGK